MPRQQKVVFEDVGFEIKGKEIVNQPDDIELDVPNGDLSLGEKVFNDSCGGCHQLDHDFSLGPALRTVYLRKAGSRKNFSLYGSTIGTKPRFWTKQRLWEFLENPEKMYPNTNMSFDGIQDPLTLASLVEYLHYLRICTVTSEKQTKRIII